LSESSRTGEPLPAPRGIPAPKRWPDSETLEAFDLLPKIPWAKGIRRFWQPGEAGAWQRLTTFLEQAIADYSVGRDRPDWEGVSYLSPHLHFGEISPRQLWHGVRQWEGRSTAKREAGEGFLRQLGWREFAHHLLFHYPHTPERPLRSEFEAFPWKNNARWLRAWQQGLTGYPFVDAGLRQLWTTGWMHNRVRMVVASFLVKDLRIDWRRGAEWFWDTLVDADLANNTLGWQWTAGCGADAAPYFRVFNRSVRGRNSIPRGVCPPVGP
jgi:deoxyribodipyrimidine photo-lyase